VKEQGRENGGWWEEVMDGVGGKTEREIGVDWEDK